MTLETLIKNNLLEKFIAPLEKAKKELAKGVECLNVAKLSMDADLMDEEYYRRMVYGSIYNASMFASMAFLFSENYRAKQSSRYHATLLEAAENIFRDSNKLDEKTKNIITSLHKIRKKRNDINYDELPSDISKAGLKDAIGVVEKWAEKIRNFIQEKEASENLL